MAIPRWDGIKGRKGKIVGLVFCFYISLFSMYWLDSP